ncbi:MAG: C25 family cysteine peptidase [Candidatus Hydrogenedens sp.]
MKVPNVGDRLNTYMNWWGYLDKTPGHLHVPWGETNFQVKATFRQVKALVIECCDRWLPTLPCRTEAETELASHCYDVKYLSSVINNNWWPIDKQEVINALPSHDIFVFSGHSSVSSLQFCTEGDNCSIGTIEINYHREGHPYKFVLILGCMAGDNIDNWQSNFGASCIIAFSGLLYEDVANSWDWRFWEYVFSNNYTIRTGALQATYDTYEAYDYFVNYPEKEFHIVIRGNGVL